MNVFVVSVQMDKKKGQYANSMSFCWRSNLSDDDIISAFVNTYVAFCDLLQV